MYKQSMRTLCILVIMLWTTISYATIKVDDVQNPSYYGAYDGIITVEATGDAGDFQVLYKDQVSNVICGPYTGSGLISNDDCGLGVGTYTVCVIDRFGCEDNMEVTLTADCFIEVEIESINFVTKCSIEACDNETGCTNDGAIIINVLGSANYSINWTGPSGFESTEAILSDLASGNYAYTVTDTNFANCTQKGIVEVKVCSTSVEEYEGDDVTCNIFTQSFNPKLKPSPVSEVGSSDGSFTFSAEYMFHYTVFSDDGNDEPFRQDGTTENLEIRNLSYGMYYVAIEPLGCEEALYYYFVICEPITLGYITVDNCCKIRDEGDKDKDGICTGSGYIGGPRTGSDPTDIEVSGGKGPYTYYYRKQGDAKLYYGAKGHTELACEGTYEIYVQDALGCTSSARTVVVPKAQNNKVEREVVNYEFERVADNSLGKSFCEVIATVEYFCTNNDGNRKVFRTQRYYLQQEFSPDEEYPTLKLQLPKEYDLNEKTIDVTDQFGFFDTPRYFLNDCGVLDEPDITIYLKEDNLKNCTSRNRVFCASTDDNPNPNDDPCAGIEEFEEWITINGQNYCVLILKCNGIEVGEFIYPTSINYVTRPDKCIYLEESCNFGPINQAQLIYCPPKIDLPEAGPSAPGNHGPSGGINTNDNGECTDWTLTQRDPGKCVEIYICSNGEMRIDEGRFEYQTSGPDQYYMSTSCPSGWACGSKLCQYSSGDLEDVPICTYRVPCDDPETITCQNCPNNFNSDGVLLRKKNQGIEVEESVVDHSIQTIIFPNPFTNSFTLQIESNIDQEIALDIFSYLGQHLMNMNFTLQTGTNTYEIDALQDLPNGIYTIRVSDKSEVLKVERVIKL